MKEASTIRGKNKSENEILNFCGIEDKFSKVAPMEIDVTRNDPIEITTEVIHI